MLKNKVKCMKKKVADILLSRHFFYIAQSFLPGLLKFRNNQKCFHVFIECFVIKKQLFFLKNDKNRISEKDIFFQKNSQKEHSSNLLIKVRLNRKKLYYLHYMYKIWLGGKGWAQAGIHRAIHRLVRMAATIAGKTRSGGLPEALK